MFTRCRRDTAWQPLVAGALTAFPLLAESKQRRAELMLYTMPKGVEVCWRFLVSRGYVTGVPLGEVLLFAVALAVFLAVERRRHKAAFRGLLKLLFGDQSWPQPDVKVLQDDDVDDDDSGRGCRGPGMSQ